MVLVHMGTRPARARLICMARAWLATLLSRDQSCQSKDEGRGLPAYGSGGPKYTIINITDIVID